jgi:glycosyltransferase involved in cell wall biosynthesis
MKRSATALPEKNYSTLGIQHIMRKIALVSEHASPLASLGSVDSGGQNVYVAHLAKQLAQAGYLVDVFTRHDGKGLPRVVEWGANLRVVHVPAGPARFVPKESLLPYMDEFARYMIAFAREEPIPYDLVHANFFMSGMVARQVRQVLGIPYVMTFHALGRVRRLCQGKADGFPADRFAIEEELMHDADRIIAECPQDRQDMEELYGARRSRIDIVPCGFDPQELWPLQTTARRQLGLDPADFIVLQLGRMVPRKGVDDVVRAVGLLRRSHGIRARLLIVGGETGEADILRSPEPARLHALAVADGIADQVIFTGKKDRSTLRHYYSAANVFVTTPWYEPFGITPLEAMACATPVIGAAVGGIRTTVVDGRTGYLVPPKDPAAIAEKLALLHDDPLHATRLGMAGLRRARRYYTWEKVAKQIAAVYHAAIDAPSTDDIIFHPAVGRINPMEVAWTPAMNP